MLKETLRTIREFSLELTIAALLIFNLSLAMLSAKKNGSFANLKHRELSAGVHRRKECRKVRGLCGGFSFAPTLPTGVGGARVCH